MRPDSSTPYGPVQEVEWSPISFGRSDVRRRHMPAFRRGASSAYLVGLIADQSQALPSPPRTLVDKGRFHIQIKTGLGFCWLGNTREVFNSDMRLTTC